MRALLCVTACLFSSCSPAWELVTDRATYARGETIQLTLRNHSLQMWGYNLCDLQFEPRLDDERRVCAAILNGLPALDTARVDRIIPTDAAPGPYAVKTIVSPWDNGSVGGEAVATFTITQ